MALWADRPSPFPPVLISDGSSRSKAALELPSGSLGLDSSRTILGVNLASQAIHVLSLDDRIYD
jgi:hypothetical protein